MKYDVAIVGAGVLGTSLAYHLSRRGIKTLVLEREPFVAAHASGKNAGMIRSLYRHPQLTSWADRSVNGWPNELRQKFFTQTGSLIVGRDIPDHSSQLFMSREYQAPDGNSLPAVYCPTDGLLDSGSYVQALMTEAVRHGARFVFRTCVTKVHHSVSSWTLLDDQHHQYHARSIVNAAGAWLNACLADDSSRVDARAYARHLFVVEGWQKDFMPATNCGFFWDEHLEWYMRRWTAEARLVSICERIAADPDHFIPGAIGPDQLATKLLQALPAVADNLRLGRSWHCFRTYTEDQLPIWGPDTNLPSYFWLAAFGGFGMSTSYAAAEDAARYLAGESFDLPADFLPLRAQGSAQRQNTARPVAIGE